MAATSTVNNSLPSKQASKAADPQPISFRGSLLMHAYQ